MGITVRRADATDARALAELAARTFEDTFSADNRPEDIAIHVARSYGPQQQLSEIIDPGIRTLLAEVDGELAGYAQLREGSPPESVAGAGAVELWRFYVSRTWHGRGVAQALMKHVEHEALSRGMETLWLGVWERNERAKAFYTKAGFVDVGSHVFMVGSDPQTDRILTRRLRAPGPDGAA